MNYFFSSFLHFFVSHYFVTKLVAIWLYSFTSVGYNKKFIHLCNFYWATLKKAILTFFLFLAVIIFSLLLGCIYNYWNGNL